MAIELTREDMQKVRSLGSGPVSYDSIVNLRSGQWDRAAKYEAYRSRLDDVLRSSDPRDVAAVMKENAGFTRVNNLINRDIAPGTVHQSAALANLSVQYANEEYIGEQLMPVVPVSKLTDQYYTYGMRDRFAYPEDALGVRGDANEVTENRSTETYQCLGYGYTNYLDADTLYDQDAPLNEMVDLQEAILEGLAFRRELRISTVMTTAGNYGANTTAIAAANRWNTVAGGNPISDLQTGMAALFLGAGPSQTYFFSSLDVYNVLSRHPMILDLFKYGGTSPGLATPDMIAKFFGADRYLIGKARQDTANEAAATATWARVWGDSFGIVRVLKRPTKRNAAFGVTFRHRNIESRQWFDERKGVHGGYFAKAAVSETHDVVAPLTGYLITTPI
jgi:hypothetical protein